MPFSVHTTIPQPVLMSQIPHTQHKPHTSNSSPTHATLSDEDAFKQSVECITGPISRIISSKGINAVYEALDDEGKKVFEQAYSAAYHPSLDVCMEIYEVRHAQRLMMACEKRRAVVRHHVDHSCAHEQPGASL